MVAAHASPYRVVPVPIQYRCGPIVLFWGVQRANGDVADIDEACGAARLKVALDLGELQESDLDWRKL